MSTLLLLTTNMRININHLTDVAELKEALGTSADITVFRKLNELNYRTCYSHKGRYYTLENIPEFDEWGLWSFRSVWFSIRGTLLNTALHFVENADAGFFASELEALLHVEVKDCLKKLTRQKKIDRTLFAGKFLYCSHNLIKQRPQLATRQIQKAEYGLGEALAPPELVPDELKAAIILFFSLLDERQRRLYAGLESLKMGHGGDQAIANLLGLDVGTIARGRKELLQQDMELERIRKIGGGRKSVEKKRRKSSRGSKK